MSNILKVLAAGSASEPTDEYFNQTTLLLHGDGTNGAQNNTFLDSSTNNFTITRNGNTTQGTFSPFSVADGEWSGYFAGGATSYIETDATTLFNQNAAATFQCWIYPTKFTTSTSAVRRMYVFIKGIIYAGLSIHSDGTLGWYGYPAGSIITASPSGTIVTNEWQHIAIVMNPSSNYIKLYKNGVEVGTSAYSAYGTNGAALRIGNGDTGQPTDSFIGYMSNVKVSASVATLDYASPPVPSTTSGAGLLTLQANRFYDASGNRTVTPQASVSIQPFSPFAPSAAYSPSVNGGSGYFDGSGGYLRADAVLDSLTTTSSPFTIEGWVYPLALGDQSNNDDCIIGMNTEASGYNALTISNTQLRWNASEIGHSDLNINRWNHFAFVYNGSGFTFYINGTSDVTSATAISTAPSNLVFAIGAEFDSANGGSPGNYYDGYISDIKVSNTAVYSSNFSLPTAPSTPAGNTLFLCNFTNAGIFDNTGKNNLETVADAQIDTTTKKYGTGSMEFDGTGDRLIVAHTVNQMLDTGPFTIEMWIYPTNVSPASNFSFICKGASSATGTWQFDINSTSKLRFQYDSAGAITSSASLVVNTWTHIAVVREGTGSNQTKLYINGTNDGTGTVSSNFNTTATLKIGQNRDSNTDYPGYIDDLRISRVARYTTTFTPPTKAFPDL